MNNLSFYELMSFAKTFSKFFYLDRNVSATKEEQNAAVEVLKKMADNRGNWTQEQKESYKALVDFVKEVVEDSDAK
jgi:hypothetical protein